MPCRTAISVLILLVGTLGATAAPVDPALRNQQFQPGASRSFSVLRPSQVRISAGKLQQPGVTARVITPASRPAVPIQRGAAPLAAPGKAVVQPSVTKVAGS